MSPLRLLFRLTYQNQKTELFLILGFTLLYPDKGNQYYYLVFALLMTLIIVRRVWLERNFFLSPFVKILIMVNLLLIFSVLFSVTYFNSLLFLSDIILVSLYFIFFSKEEKQIPDYLKLFTYIITLFSLVNVLNHITGVLGSEDLFFISTIIKGIISGIGVIIAFYFLLKRFDLLWAGIFIVNLASLLSSGSKAALIGVAGAMGFFIFRKNWKYLLGIIPLILIIWVMPNPVKKSIQHSLDDPFLLYRFKVWKMSLRVFGDNLPFGVGLDNFSKVAKKYTFKSPDAPANYSKVARRTHNDYLKFMAETGLIGLLIILISLFLLLRRLKLFSRNPLIFVLLFYFLFQALLFNLFDKQFILIIFLFLIRMVGTQKDEPVNFNRSGRISVIFFVLLIFCLSYLFPFISSQYLARIPQTRDPLKSFRLFDRAIFFAPLNSTLYFERGQVLYNYFAGTRDFTVFPLVVENLKKAQSLNNYYQEAYILESNLYFQLLKNRQVYPELKVEMQKPLQKAEEYFPKNPFIKLRKADILVKFREVKKARQEALAALELEPSYLAAWYFLYKNTRYFSNQASFVKKIIPILRKSLQINPKPGSYLYSLYRLPPGLDQELHHFFLSWGFK